MTELSNSIILAEFADPNGRSVLIQFSPAALIEIDRLFSKRSVQPCPRRLRIALVQGGCEDWTYMLEFAPDSSPGDVSFMVDSWEILVPSTHTHMLAGLTIDYSEDLMGGSFRLDNPNASRTCSCGTSFRVATA